MRRRMRSTDGQASVELVALLPLLVLLVAALAQGALAGWAAWSAAGAARSAARAHAIGAPPLGAARRALPLPLRDAVAVRTDGDAVRVTLRVPLLVGGGTLTTVRATARLTPQDGA